MKTATKTRSFNIILFFCVTLVLLSACGGGGGGNGDADEPNTAELRGTAATGLAIDGIVYITGSDGVQINVITDSNGDYIADISGMTAPFIISAVPDNTNLPTQYSYASGPGVINITPLTTLALFNATGQTDLSNLERNWAARSGEVVAADLRAAQTMINANFASVFADQSIDPATYDFFTTAFVVGQGFDLVLDRLEVDINQAEGTFTIRLDGNPQAFNQDIDISGFNIGSSGGPVTNDAVIFDDDFGPNVRLTDFLGFTNDARVDTSEHILGSASLRVEVPTTDFTGGLFKAVPGRNLSGYNALSFWAKTNQGIGNILDDVFFGVESTTSAPYGLRISNGFVVTNEWQQFIIPLPNPSVLTDPQDLFGFVERSGITTAYTLWFDDIRFVSLNPGVITNPSPVIVSEEREELIGNDFIIVNSMVSYDIHGETVTMDLLNTGYLDYASSDESVAIVDAIGVVEVIGPGSTTITVSLAGQPASGILTINVKDPAVVFDDALNGLVFTAFGGSTNDVRIDTSEAFSGSASYRIEVPASGYTGGAFTTNTGLDLSGYNALTFYAKASATGKTLDVAGFGDNAAGDTTFSTELNDLVLTPFWKKFTIPFTDASVLTNIEGAFHFAEGSDQGAYTLWLDDIQYVNVFDGLVYVADAAVDSQFELFRTANDPDLSLKLPGTRPLSVSVTSYAISPDRTRVAFLGDFETAFVDELFVASLLDDSPPIKVSGGLVDGGEVFSFQWSPDGSRLAYLADQDSDNVDQLYTVLPNGSSPVKVSGGLVDGGDVLDGFQWSPDGSRLAYLADQEAINRFELYTVLPDGSSPPKKVSGVLVDGGDVATFEWSPDSSRLAYDADQVTQGVTELYTVLPDGSSPVKVSGDLGDFGDVFAGFQWSPDSSRIAYRVYQDNFDVLELYTTLPDNPSSVKVSGGMVAGGYVFRFEWSPDSSRLAYLADQETDNIFELYTVLPDGSSPVKVSGGLVDGGDVLDGFQWSPDGSRLAYLADKDTFRRIELHTVLPDGSSPVKVSDDLVVDGDVLTFEWSPNSSRLAYDADQDTDNVFELYTVLPDGLSPPVKVSGVLPGLGSVTSDFQWSPDSRWIAYSAGQITAFVFELFTVRADGMSNAKVSKPLVLGGDVSSFAWE